MDKYIKNIKILTIAEIISKLNILLVLPIVTRYFGTINYGAWGQINILVAIAIPVMILGMESSLIRFLPGMDSEKKKKIFSGILILLAIFSLIIILILSIFSEDIFNLFFKGYSVSWDIVLFSLLLAFVNVFTNIFKAWFRANNDAANYSKVLIILSILNIISIIGVILLKGDLFELVCLRLIYEALLVCWIVYTVYKQYGFSSPDFSYIGKFIKYGLPLLPGAYAMFLLNAADRIVLVQYVSIAHVGIYTLAYNIGSMALQATVNPVWTMYPNMASEYYNTDDMNNLTLIFQKSSLLMLFIASPLLAGAIVLSRDLILIFGGSQYILGKSIIPIVILGYIFHLLASYYDILLGLKKKQYLSTLTIIIASLLNVVLNLIFIPRYGIMAAAITTSVSFISQFILSYIFARKILFIKLEIIKIFKVIIASILMGIVVFFSSKYLFINLVPDLFINIIIGVVVYMLISFKMGLIPKSIIDSSILKFRE